MSSKPASFLHALENKVEVFLSKSSGAQPAIQGWVDTGAYGWVVLKGLLACSSASFLQLIFSGVEAFVV